MIWTSCNRVEDHKQQEGENLIIEEENKKRRQLNQWSAGRGRAQLSRKRNQVSQGVQVSPLLLALFLFLFFYRNSYLLRRSRGAYFATKLNALFWRGSMGSGNCDGSGGSSELHLRIRFCFHASARVRNSISLKPRDFHDTVLLKLLQAKKFVLD